VPGGDATMSTADSQTDAARRREDVTSAGETASVVNYEAAIFAVEQAPQSGSSSTCRARA
jgi:hypothetical protein